jgi:hypothetical protein
MSNKLAYTYEIYIGAPVDRVWTGLIDGDITKKYVYGTRFDGKLKKGARYAYVGDGDFKVVDGDSRCRARQAARDDLASALGRFGSERPAVACDVRAVASGVLDQASSRTR